MSIWQKKQRTVQKMLRLYAIFDDKNDIRQKSGAFEVNSIERAKILNKQGYGIFFTPNKFKGRRIKANLEKIEYYIADIDEGGKEKIWSDIEKLILKPSVIVESKRGYHLYWRVSDGTMENYEKIENCIIAKMNADKGAKDVTRLLRYPNFYHMKDSNNPFLIKIIEKNDNIYRENELYLYFRGHEKKYKPICLQNIKFKKLDDFESNEQMLKFFGFKSNTNERHNELLRKIGMMKILQYSQTDRERIILYMNTQFYKPLPDSEVKTILRTTVNGCR